MATLSRSRSPKRRRDKPPARTTIVRGIVITIIFLLIGFQALRLYNGLPTTNYSKQFVSVPTVGNLLAHDFVRIGGKRVGQVYSVDVGDDGRPRVELQLDPGLKLPKDTKVAVRANGLLGARYIQLIPGQSNENLPEESTIRGDDQSYTDGLPEFFATFDDETRGGLQDVITQFGGGVQFNGVPLNAAIKDLRYGAPKFQSLVQEILDQDGAAARFFPSFASGMEALDEATPYIRPGTRAAQAALDPFVSERDAVRESLDEFPPTFDAMREGLPGGTRFLASVGTISRALSDTLPPAPAGFAALGRTFETTPGPLKVLEEATASDRLGIAPRAPVKLLRPLRGRLFDQLSQLVYKNIDPPVNELTRRSCDIKNFGAVMRSMTGFQQNGGGNGPLGPFKAFRLQAALPNPVSIFGLRDPSFRREGSGEQPCKYLSKEYEQFDLSKSADVARLVNR